MKLEFFILLSQSTQIKIFPLFCLYMLYVMADHLFDGTIHKGVPFIKYYIQNKCSLG